MTVEPGTLPRSLGDAIRVRAEEDPAHEFLVTEDRRLTYRQVDLASRALAERLLHAGVGKGTRVGLYFGYSPEFVVSWLAAARIGALVVPISTLYTGAEISGVLRQADIHLLITQSEVGGRDVTHLLADALPALGRRTDRPLSMVEAPYLREVWMGGSPQVPAWATAVDLIDERSESPELLAAVEAEVGLADLAVVVYTSGTSAEPKGVVHTHGSVLRSSRNLPRRVQSMSGGLPPCVLCGMPFFWVGGILVLTAALLSPITLVMTEKFAIDKALDLIERERVTYVSAWPTVIAKLRDLNETLRRDVGSARVLLGGPVDMSQVDVPIPGVSSHRGMSETMGSFASTEVSILDPVTGKSAEPGAVGELLVRGPGVMDGYYKRERSDVFDQDGWYHSGDQAARVDGDDRVFFSGRDSEMLKVSGANVSPREIEAVAEQSPCVRACYVVGPENVTTGQEVVAILVPEPETDFDQDAVSRFMRERLSAFKMPRHWFVMDEAEVPILGSGKPDRRRLKATVEGELSNRGRSEHAR